MRLITNTIILLTIALCGTANAQELEKDMFKPYGENTNSCYGNVLVNPVYDTIVEQIEIVAGYTYLKRKAPVYDTIVEKILVRPGYTKYEVIEPVFETTMVRVKIKDTEMAVSSKAMAPMSKTTQKIEKTPMLKVWKKTKRKSNCKSTNPEDCLTWGVESISAQSIMIEREVPETLVRDASNIVQIEEQYIMVEKKVLKQEGSVKEVNVLPEYKEVTRYLRTASESFQEISVPPVYKQVTRIKLVSQGGQVEPREVVCPKDYAKYLQPLQEKLQTLGYDIGTADGVFGRKTKDAILQYQVNNNLPVGQLDWETLKRLKVIE